MVVDLCFYSIQLINTSINICDGILKEMQYIDSLHSFLYVRAHTNRKVFFYIKNSFKKAI